MFQKILCFLGLHNYMLSKVEERRHAVVHFYRCLECEKIRSIWNRKYA
jgi:hypothetical protein